jgi:Tol biopolymer transport system component
MTAIMVRITGGLLLGYSLLSGVMLLLGAALPSMGQVAYLTIDTEHNQMAAYRLYMQDASRGVALRLSDIAVKPCCLHWSPDGRWLLFVALGNAADEVGDFLYVLDPYGGTLRQLTPGYGDLVNPVWSPDSQQIGYVVTQAAIVTVGSVVNGNEDANRQQAFQVRLDDGTIRSVGDAAENHFRVGWSADGALIYTLTDRDGGSAFGGTTAIFSAVDCVQACESVLPQRVTRLFALAEDQMALAVNSSARETALFQWSVGAAAPRKLTAFPPNVRVVDVLLTADGQQLLIGTEYDALNSFYALDLLTGEREWLLQTDRIYDAPTRSSDGRYVAYLRYESLVDDLELYLYDFVQSVEIRLTFDQFNNHAPAWRPG